MVTASPYTRHLDESATIDTGRLWDLCGMLPSEAGVACVTAVAGIVARVRAPGPPRRIVAALVLLVVAGVAFASRYRILDVSSYLLPATAGLVLLGAVGVDEMLVRFPGSLGPSGAIGLAAVLALVVLPWSARGNRLADRRAGRVWAEALVESAKPPAILVVEGDTTIHGLWYLDAVGEAPREISWC